MIKKVIKVLLTLGLTLMFAGVSSAYASYTESSNEIKVIYEDKPVNFTWLYNQINNDSILSHKGSIWFLNASIRLYTDSEMYINDTEISELRISNYKSDIGLYNGKYYIENVTIKSWNQNENREAYKDEKQVGISVNSGFIRNSNLSNLKWVGANNVTKDLYNVSITDSSKGLVANSINNKSIYDIYAKNLTGSAIELYNCKNTEVYNVKVKDAGNYLNPGTGRYAVLYADNSNNCSMHNVFVNGTGWSSICVSGNSSFIDIYDVIVYNSGHNGLDIHWGNNIHVKNMSIHKSVSNNILVTYPTGGYGTYDVILEDTNSYDAYPGAGALIGTCASNVTFINYSSINDGTGITSLNSLNLKAINVNVSNSTNAVSFTKDSTYNEDVKNATIIDSDLSNKNTRSILLTYSTNSKFINVDYEILKLDNRYTSEATFYYYFDVLVNDSNNGPVNSATVYLVDETGISTNTNADGDKVTCFKTQSNGRTPFPVSNRVESPSMSEYYVKSSGTRQNFSHSATIITPDNRTISLSGITPDSSWYRKDPNIPTYTITAIIPDNSKGPHITGFAPSRDNPFNPGEKKNFRVWTDEPLTSMEWRVNGSPVHNGSLNYTWTVTDRNTTIEFIGSNANGTVKHIWPLGESHDEPSIPDDNPTQEIQFSPSDSKITLNVSEKTVFSVNPDIFITKEWYINGCLIQNNTASMTRCWSTAGTRDVTFKGAGNGEPVSHNWTVNVVEEERNDEESTESIIAITPEYQIVKPKQSFGLDITVDPSTPIIGTQLDFIFNSSMALANSVTEGDLFKQKGESTFFNEGDINSSEGTIKHIYGLIIGTSNVSSPGTFATVNLTAGNKTGMAEFSLSNVLISDINSKSVPYTVTNATVLIDTAPVIDPVCCPKSVDEKSNLTFKISAKDADGDRLTLSALGLPEGASFNRTSGAFSWTPAVGQAGVYTITFKVSDGYLTDSENVTVMVNKLNNPPVINFFEPINSSSFSEGERIGISVNATDAEKQALNYSIKIDGVMYSSDPAYIWETDYSSSGNHTIEVSASDGIDEAKMQHSIYISECHPRYDVNEDGVVNILDITNVSREYETTVSKPYPRYDTNQDGEINILDLTLVGHHFGEKVE